MMDTMSNHSVEPVIAAESLGKRFGEVLGGPHQFVGVIDEFGHQPVPVGGV